MGTESWQVMQRESVMKNPYISMTMEQVRLPDGQIIPDWPMIHARDYVNILVFNVHGLAMLVESYQHGVGRASWQVVSGYLEEEEDPWDAAQRVLVTQTGYSGEEWLYLGSFVVDADRHVGTGHYFVLYNAGKVAEPAATAENESTFNWVTPEDLKNALWDGRIGAVSYAITISLGLLALNRRLNYSVAAKIEEHHREMETFPPE